MIPLTIITASFQQGQFIRRTIESVLTPGIIDLEYLVYDGGSSDETLAVLADFQGRLNWTSEPDRGQSHAINKGLTAARGAIVGWLNSDDLYTSEALSTVLAAFAADPSADVVYGDARYIDESDQDLGPYPVEAWSPDRLREECFLAQPAVFVRRRVIERVGLLDEGLHYAMDYDYWLRMVNTGMRVVHLPRVLAKCRLHGEAKTVIGGLPLAREVFEVQRRHSDGVSENAIRRYVRELVQERGFGPDSHPILHRLAAAPLAQAFTLRYAPRQFGKLIKWQLDWPFRWLRKQGRTGPSSPP